MKIVIYDGGDNIVHEDVEEFYLAVKYSNRQKADNFKGSELFFKNELPELITKISKDLPSYWDIIKNRQGPATKQQ